MRPSNDQNTDEEKIILEDENNVHLTDENQSQIVDQSGTQSTQDNQGLTMSTTPKVGPKKKYLLE